MKGITPASPRVLQPEGTSAQLPGCELGNGLIEAFDRSAIGLGFWGPAASDMCLLTAAALAGNR